MEIPSIGLRAPVVPVGVANDGQMALPADPLKVGWYRFGPQPGSAAGSAVIAGHRDSREYGKGALYPALGVGVGDQIVVRRADRTAVRYRVVAREWIPKGVLPLAELFDRSGPPRLRVITCGGDFVRGRGYADNVVVTAVPLEGR